MKTVSNRSLITIVCLFMLFSRCYTDDNEKTRLLTYADKLYSENEYYRAITEYRRYISYFPEDEYVNQAKASVARCYFYGDSPQELINWCKTVLSNSMDGSHRSEVMLFLSKGYMLLSNNNEANQVLDSLISTADVNYSNDAHFLKGISYVNMNSWDMASNEFALVNQNSPYYPRAQLYKQSALEGNNLKFKNVNKATALSVVPGLGYIYTNNYQTGVSSFVVNTLFAWGTYNAFRKKETGVGVVIGLFSIGWYTGNLYGGYASANRFNEQKETKFKESFFWK